MDTSTISKILSAKQDEKFKLAAKLSELDQEISELESTLKVLTKYSAVLRSKDIDEGRVKGAVVASLIRTITKREQILGAALQEIKEKQPIHTEVLLEMIEKRGVQISGDGKKGQLANLSAYLSRAKDEIGIEPSRQGWLLSVSNPQEKPGFPEL